MAIDWKWRKCEAGIPLGKAKPFHDSTTQQGMALPAWSCTFRRKVWYLAQPDCSGKNPSFESGRRPYQYWISCKVCTEWICVAFCSFPELFSLNVQWLRMVAFLMVVICGGSKIKSFRELRRDLRTGKGRECGLLCIKRWMEETNDVSFNRNFLLPVTHQLVLYEYVRGQHVGNTADPCSSSWSRYSVKSRDTVACRVFWFPFPLFLSIRKEE